jgi:hypothetical protein
MHAGANSLAFQVRVRRALDRPQPRGDASQCARPQLNPLNASIFNFMPNATAKAGCP